MKEVFTYEGGYHVAVDLSVVAVATALRKVRDTTGEWPNRLRVSGADEDYAEKIVSQFRYLLEELELVVDFRLPEFQWELYRDGQEGYGSEGA